MRFRATLTDSPALAKAFLPTLEKFGKACHVLLGPEEVHLLQTPADADGAHIAARFEAGALFVRDDTFKVQSRHFNLIAFAVDVTLLLKVLRSALAADADAVEVRLTQRALPTGLGGGGADGGGDEGPELENRPFLCFTARGAALSLVQDLPVSKPCTPSEIDALVAQRDAGPLCPAYLDLAPVAPRLAAALDRIKALGAAVLVAVARTGDLHVQVAEPGVALGAHFDGLAAYPADARSARDAVDRALPAEAQLHAALEGGLALAAHVQAKHLLRVLNAAALSRPSQILLGVAAGGGYAHALYVYRDPRADAPYDASIALSFRLPVRVEEEEDEVEDGGGVGGGGGGDEY